jgi:hypothetical protein
MVMMKNIRFAIFTLPAALCFLFLLFTFLKPVHAQQAQPQFLFSWHAGNSYVPSSYKGKILPGTHSQITASFELVSGGSIVSVKNQSIYWYLDDTLIGGGVGVQQITFSPFGSAPEMETLRVELPKYAGGYLIHQTTIPIMNPSVVIDIPYPGGQFSETNATATALAYFFNIPAADLSFLWSINGQSGLNTNAGSSDVAQINIPSGTPSGSTIALSLQAQNPQNGQSANASGNLIYQKQL